MCETAHGAAQRRRQTHLAKGWSNRRRRLCLPRVDDLQTGHVHVSAATQPVGRAAGAGCSKQRSRVRATRHVRTSRMVPATCLPAPAAAAAIATMAAQTHADARQHARPGASATPREGAAAGATCAAARHPLLTRPLRDLPAVPQQ